MKLTRRSLIARVAVGSTFGRSIRAAGSVPLLSVALDDAARPQRRAEYSFTQFHNQTTASPLHRRLVEMWDAIRTETGGRVEAEVFPQNNAIAGSDPAALAMLTAGEIHFFTLMGGILGTVVPSAEVQQVPFAFRSAAHAHRAMDGALGGYLRQEMEAKGIHGFPVGAFDNGMRQVATTVRPIVVPGDLKGMRMRVPAGAMVAETFSAFGAEPVTVNSNAIYDALRSGTVDAQENPLALVELFELYEVVKYVSMTNHMWSGFNLLAHLETWSRLPPDLRAIIERRVTRSVQLQRADQERANAGLRTELARRGLVFNDVDPAPFRRQLSGLYATWRERLGPTCWSLLEAEVGTLA